MNLQSIGDLLNRITIHYPRFRNDISTKDGSKIRMDVVKEWHRLIGFLEYEEALERLDLYMLREDNRKPPMPRDFLRNKPAQKPEEWRAPISHQWHLEFQAWDKKQMHGRLFDQEGREYVHDPVYEDGYHYDFNGRICTMDGRVVYQ